jgi:hypothetical protein
MNENSAMIFMLVVVPRSTTIEFCRVGLLVVVACRHAIFDVMGKSNMMKKARAGLITNINLRVVHVQPRTTNTVQYRYYSTHWRYR